MSEIIFETSSHLLDWFLTLQAKESSVLINESSFFKINFYWSIAALQYGVNHLLFINNPFKSSCGFCQSILKEPLIYFLILTFKKNF